MLRDNHGLGVTTDAPAAVAALDRTIEGFLKYRTDTSASLKQVLAADGELGLAYCLQGYFGMLGFAESFVPRAAEAAKKARAFTRNASPREQQHVDALDAWVAGDLDRMLDIWEAILAQHPHDVLAFRLAHFNAFWLGRPKVMRDSVDRIFSKWDASLPAWGTVLACRCFSYEESGDYSAEADGRKAVELDLADLWATHAVAHVLEMQGRSAEGIKWLSGLAQNWGEANNIAHHVWWHRGMYHLERGEFDAVLDLYDQRFRNLQSPLTKGQPDLYIDIQNAASILFRLERQGVNVGDRWVEIADKAEARISDHRSAFTLPHWMMALAAAGRQAAAQRMLQAMADYGRQTGTLAAVVGSVALPVCKAVLAHRKGQYEEALTVMRPVLGEMTKLGGSHAQQDVLEQLFLECAVKANRSDDVRRLVGRVASKYPTPLNSRIGYSAAITQFGL